MATKIVLIGASLRPQIPSTLAAGCSPIGFDLFADWDSQMSVQSDPQAIASIQKIGNYRELIGRPIPNDASGVVFWGGSEQNLDLVRFFASQNAILGPSVESLIRLKDTFGYLATIQSAGFQTPAMLTCLPTENLQDWLCKPTGSCGGSQIKNAAKYSSKLHRQNVLIEQRPRKLVYFQKRLSGHSYSALFVSFGKSDRLVDEAEQPRDSSELETKLLGVTRQVVGDPTLGAQPFSYCGSLGPTEELADDKTHQLQELADYVAQEWKLTGIWGMDFIVNQQGLWPLDINPRIPASAELFESRVASMKANSGADQVCELPGSIVGVHLAACQWRGQATVLQQLDLQMSEGMTEGMPEGKLILFNRTANPVLVSTSIHDRFTSQHRSDFFQGATPATSLCDIPFAGSVIQPGHPIATVRVRAESMEEVKSKLQSRVAATYQLIDS